jgi:uncharacterized protein YegP (UPF0339 family)
MYYVIYREADSHLWRWTLYGEKDRMIAQSVEKHYNRADCLAAIDSVKNSGSAEVRERVTSGPCAASAALPALPDSSSRHCR